MTLPVPKASLESLAVSTKSRPTSARLRRRASAICYSRTTGAKNKGKPGLPPQRDSEFWSRLGLLRDAELYRNLPMVFVRQWTTVRNSRRAWSASGRRPTIVSCDAILGVGRLPEHITDAALFHPSMADKDDPAFLPLSKERTVRLEGWIGARAERPVACGFLATAHGSVPGLTVDPRGDGFEDPT